MHAFPGTNTIALFQFFLKKTEVSINKETTLRLDIENEAAPSLMQVEF